MGAGNVYKNCRYVFGKNNLVNVIYYGELIALLIINIVFIIDPCFLPPANCTFQQLEN